MSFNDLVTLLGTVHPEHGKHFTERNHVLHYNAQPNSYNIKDPEEEALKAREALRLENAQATEAQLVAEQNRVRTLTENTNRTVRNTLPEWRLMKRDANNDLRLEDSLLVFLDAKHTTVDWYVVVKNLKKLGEPLGYTEMHYLNALQRFIGYFAPALKTVTDELNATDLAKFLMRMSVPQPKFERLTTQIQALTRHVNENLRTIMAQLHGMTVALYSNKSIDEQKALINRLMITGLINFTAGPTRQALIATIENNQINNKTPDWKILIESVISSERVHGMPQVNLSFKATVPQATSLFNTMLLPVDSPAINPYSPVEYGIHPVNPIYNPNNYGPYPTGRDYEQSFYVPKAPKSVTQPVQPTFNPTPVRTQPVEVRNPPPPVPSSSGAVPKSTRATPPVEKDKTPSEPRKSKRQRRKAKLYEPETGSYVYLTYASANSSRSTSPEVQKDQRHRSNSKSKGHEPRQKQKSYDNRQKPNNNYSDSSKSRNSSQSSKGSKSPFRSNNKKGYNKDKSKNNKGKTNYKNKNSYRGSSNSKSPQRDNRNRARSNTPSKYPDFHPGVNCSADYKPWIMKSCFKCNTRNEHHEHLCPNHYKFNPKKCSKCRSGFHFPDECSKGNQRSRSPSSNSSKSKNLN
jgi:hypothetical protein